MIEPIDPIDANILPFAVVLFLGAVALTKRAIARLAGDAY
jgi:hypothetical protein